MARPEFAKKAPAFASSTKSTSAAPTLGSNAELNICSTTEDHSETILAFIALQNPADSDSYSGFHKRVKQEQGNSPALSSPSSPGQESNSDGRRTPPELTLSTMKPLGERIGGPRQALNSIKAEEISPRDSDDSDGLSGGSNCTAEMLDQQRKQRLQRNREAAQQCRKRKKEYVKGIESEIAKLRTENRQLRARMSAQSSENHELHQENTMLRSIVTSRSATQEVVPTNVVDPKCFNK